MELSYQQRDQTSLASRMPRRVACPVLRALGGNVHQQWCNAPSFDSIRILDSYGEVKERRHQRQHPPAAKPQLQTTAPNQLWSWDITKLKGASKWQHYYLYLILDVYSRFVVGWLLAEVESAELAHILISTKAVPEFK
jgi:transposase InsO family protein